LREALDGWISGDFSRGDTNLFRPLYDSLLDRDEYMLLADYRSYVECQQSAAEIFLAREKWNRMSILNIARIGEFSSDRAIQQYCEDIWRTGPIKSRD
jgi:glycogen phosphorylase